MTWTARADRWVHRHPWGPDVALALAVAAVVGWGSLDVLRVADGEVWVRWAAGGCAVVLHAAVALRRVATEAAFLIASLTMLALVALPNVRIKPRDLALSDDPEALEVPLLFLPSSVLYLLLLHAVAAHRGQPRSGLALGIAVTGAGLGAARTATASGALPAGWLTVALTLLALVAAAAGTWAVGTVQRDRHLRRTEETAEAAEQATVEERRRIARDMHDIVAHSLAVIVRQAEGGRSVVAAEPDRAATALSAISATARQALTDMRSTLAVLDVGTDRTVRHAAQPTLAEVPALVSRVRAAGVDVSLVHDDGFDGMTPGAATAAYRVVQEALTNCVKHSGPGCAVRVRIEHAAHECTVTVADEGGQAQPVPLVPGTGAGLRGVRDRVRAAGGSFRAGPTAQGFLVSARFPRADGAGPG
ncbi:sensor histidine kinase [Modestobacter sp. I12A-02662]|uniref:sensor histidine kinase n=1 Tax=Modestobacter sp. I12A-02662 TaxID=1730496 RepID=UPI0034DE8BE7